MNYATFSVNIIYSFVKRPVVFFPFMISRSGRQNTQYVRLFNRGQFSRLQSEGTTVGNIYNIYIIIECIKKINLNSFLQTQKKTYKSFIVKPKTIRSLSVPVYSHALQLKPTELKSSISISNESLRRRSCYEDIQRFSTKRKISVSSLPVNLSPRCDSPDAEPESKKNGFNFSEVQNFHRYA